MMCFSSLMHRVVALALLAGLVTGCGGGGTAAPAQNRLPVTPTLNALPSAPVPANSLKVTVDAGPADTGYNVNRLYTDVTICQPDSVTQCQTIDHVLVDTGSTGLRLLSGALAPGLNLIRQTNSAGLPVFNCAQFVDNTFAWGVVATADVWLGGKKAGATSIQVIADGSASPPPAVACSVGGTALTTAKVLGANGIVGLGLNREDCGEVCAANAANGFYYTCANAACTASTGTTASLDRQLKNPVSLFATDNNGLLIDLPAVGTASSAGLSGSLFFGVATQANNQLAAAKILAVDSVGYITAALSPPGSHPLFFSNTIIDSGSNGFYFDAAAMPICAGADYSGFYCPASQTSLSATLSGDNGQNASLTFSIDNARTLFNTGNVVLPALAGPFGHPASFDFGLPFFYGRRVFIGIEGPTPGAAAPAFYAF